MTSGRLGGLGSLALLLGMGLGPSLAGDVELSASLATNDVVTCEPILVKVTLTNGGEKPIRVVPPFVSSGHWPLRIGVQSAADPERKEVGWMSDGDVWWRALAENVRSAPRASWLLEPGEQAGLWFDIGGFYAIRRAGRYRITLEYDPRRDMVSDADQGTPGVALWIGRAECQVGPLNVRDPTGADAAAATAIARQRRPLSCWGPDGAQVRRDVAEHARGTVYEPYVEFYDIWYAAQESVCGDPAGAYATESQLVEAAAAFRQAHPEFPLVDRLSLVPLWTRIGGTRVAATKEAQRRARENAAWPPTADEFEAEVRRLWAEGARAAWDDLEESARGLGDEWLLSEIRFFRFREEPQAGPKRRP